MFHRAIGLSAALFAAAMLHGQTITGVSNESGSANLCPGGIGFVNGSNLGTDPTKVTLTVGTKAGSVLFAFNSSLQFQVPVDVPTGATTLKVGSSAPFNIALTQYCPGIPVDSNVAAVYHLSPVVRVTTAFPAVPSERLVLSATGLGPTNPAVATGQKPNDTNSVVVTLPALTVATTTVPVSSAFLDPNNAPGFYDVTFTMPANVTTGNVTVFLTQGGSKSNTVQVPVTTAPIVTQATNGGSYNAVGPSRGLAQGGLVVLKGNLMGPQSLVVAPKPFQDTTLNGTSVTFTVNGTTTEGLMYYTSVGQVAVLMPSNTPVGQGTVTVSYNGHSGVTFPIVVVANGPGIFSVASDGQGAGIVTYPDYSLVSAARAANCGGPSTTCGAANAGDTLIIWATGLGPVNGNEAAGAGLGVNMTNIPLTVWLGNVQITPIYQGRSGCCVAEDQIAFTVPADTPVGCSVPLFLQVGNFVSNNVSLPVAPAGSRTCPFTSPALSTNAAEAVSGTSSFTFTGVQFRRQDQGPGFVDGFETFVMRFLYDPSIAPWVSSYIDDPPVGSCQVYYGLDGSPNPPGLNSLPLDAGSSITVTGAGGATFTAPNQGGDYRVTLSNTGNFFSPGTLTVTVPGGKDVGPLTVPVAIPLMPVLTSPQPDAPTPTSVTRANGFTVTWSNGSPNTVIRIEGFAATDNTYTNGVNFRCMAPSAPGSFAIPVTVTMMLPATNFGGIDFRPGIIPFAVPGSKTDASEVSLQYDYSSRLAFK